FKEMSAARSTKLAQDAWKVGQNFKGAKYILNKNTVGTLTKVKGTISPIQINTKNIGILEKVFEKALTGWRSSSTGVKASIVAVGVVSAWAAATGFGLWGQAEAPEPITFPITKFLIPEAIKTKNWTDVNNALDMAEDLSYKNANIWEKFLLWAGVGPIVGSVKKIKGGIIGIQILRKFAQDQEKKEVTGQSDPDFWKQYEEEKQQNKLEIMELQKENGERWNADKIELEKELIKLRAEAGIASDDRRLRNLQKQISMWDKRDAERRELDRLDRIAIADFWLEYRKLILKMQDESRPSNLKFGLL
ncbi:MAG: hypothetical protein IIB81_04250, partial [Nanoarchaeota archaeon]|nr:hypothetical protein [Nanoarchaeota archaeon]